MTLKFDRPFRVERTGPPGTLTLRGDGVEIHLEGVLREELPATLAGLSLEEVSRDPRRELSLRAGGTAYPVTLRHWRVHEAMPNLYAESLARHAPSASERWAARLLVATAALPGAPALYRLWHAWRSR
jgi:hypothetical protein